jgi:hypothetical protein
MWPMGLFFIYAINILTIANRNVFRSLKVEYEQLQWSTDGQPWQVISSSEPKTQVTGGDSSLFN